MSRDLRNEITSGSFDAAFSAAYPAFLQDKNSVYTRMNGILDKFSAEFGETDEVHLFSAPGRTEIGGNHTDHENGVVLAAAIDKDMIAAAAPNHTRTVRLISEGLGKYSVSLDRLEPDPAEFNTTESLIRGMAACFRQKGFAVEGFDAYVQSEVPLGSGISSSAAFEVLIGSILNGLFCAHAVSSIEIAKLAQVTENRFFGKPSGLMDQMASAVGSFVSIDFKDNSDPVIRRIDCSLAEAGYQTAVINSGADHADLTGEYAAITAEMHAVAGFFGKTVLREIDPEAFWDRIAEIRKIAGDRAVLRTIHFLEENQRAVDEAEALQAGDMERFFRLVRESGDSSFKHLQNVIVCGSSTHQELAFALAEAGHLLDGKGAVRVHGGGFAGTILAIVSNESFEAFRSGMDRVLFPGACCPFAVRQAGEIQLA